MLYIFLRYQICENRLSLIDHANFCLFDIIRKPMLHLELMKLLICICKLILKISHLHFTYILLFADLRLQFIIFYVWYSEPFFLLFKNINQVFLFLFNLFFGFLNEIPYLSKFRFLCWNFFLKFIVLLDTLR